MITPSWVLAAYLVVGLSRIFIRRVLIFLLVLSPAILVRSL